MAITPSSSAGASAPPVARAAVRPLRHRSRGRAVALSVIAGGVIGVADVTTMASPWPSVAALAVAAFLIALLYPSRWLAVAATLTLVMWLAHIWVRANWWWHPDECGPHDWTGVLAAVPSLAGAMLAGVIQLIRKQY